MKKIFLLIVTILALGSFAKADQLWYISESEAQSAVSLLQKQKYVLLYCGCCGGDVELTYVKIEAVYYKGIDDSDFCAVVVRGVDFYGNQVSKEIDLAYTHICKKNKAACVGLELGFDCSPCVEDLKWQCPKF